MKFENLHLKRFLIICYQATYHSQTSGKLVSHLSMTD